MLPSRPDEPRCSHDQHNSNDEIEFVEVFAQVAPVFAGFHAQVGKTKAPGPRAKKRVDMEAQPGHSGDAGGQSNKKSDHRKETGDKNTEAAAPQQKIMPPAQFYRRSPND